MTTKIVKNLAFQLYRTNEALETANKILAEEHLLGVLVDTNSPSFRKAKHEKKEVQKIIESAKK